MYWFLALLLLTSLVNADMDMEREEELLVEARMPGQELDYLSCREIDVQSVLSEGLKDVDVENYQILEKECDDGVNKVKVMVSDGQTKQIVEIKATQTQTTITLDEEMRVEEKDHQDSEEKTNESKDKEEEMSDDKNEIKDELLESDNNVARGIISGDLDMVVIVLNDVGEVVYLDMGKELELPLGIYKVAKLGQPIREIEVSEPTVITYYGEELQVEYVNKTMKEKYREEERYEEEYDEKAEKYEEESEDKYFEEVKKKYGDDVEIKEIRDEGDKKVVVIRRPIKIFGIALPFWGDWEEEVYIEASDLS